jgi:hypothetical protein
MNPVDFICTRLYDASVARSPASPLRVLEDALAADGFAGLYRGLTANLARIVPHTVVTFVIAETVRTRFGLRRLAPSGNLTTGDVEEKATMETLCHQIRMETIPRLERAQATEVPLTGSRRRECFSKDELRILRDELRMLTESARMPR